MKYLLLLMLTALASQIYGSGETEDPLESLPLPSGNKAVIDGMIRDGEYDELQNIGDKIAIYTQRDGAMVKIGALARTNGWLAIGVQSNSLDGAHLFFGAVEGNGRVLFQERLGQGTSHSPAQENYAGDFSLRLLEEVLIMEFEVPYDLAYSRGGKLYYAFGEETNFESEAVFQGAGRIY